MSRTELTAAEFAESITGFDEIAIAKQFQSDLYELGHTKQARALTFVHFRRDGQSDVTAYDSCMGLTVKQVTEFFADEPDEVMPEEPSSASGKDV